MAITGSSEREGDVLEARHDAGDLLRLVGRLGNDRNLLQVVDHQDEPLPLLAAMLRDELAEVVDGARGGGAAHEVQVAAVARDALQGGSKPRVRAQLGALAGLGRRGVAAQDLLLDVLDLHGATLLRQVGERRLHRDQALDEVLLLVLEADVEHLCLAGGSDVARHLEGHGRLAGTLGAADEDQLAWAHPATDRLVERHEAGGDGLEFVDVARGDALIEACQHVERGTRGQGPLADVERPVLGLGVLGGGERLVDHRDGRLPLGIVTRVQGCLHATRRVYDPPPSAPMTR